MGTGDRSERIRTYNYPQSRVTDHQHQGLTLYRLEDVLDGNLDLVLDPLLSSAHAQELSHTAKGPADGGIRRESFCRQNF